MFIEKVRAIFFKIYQILKIEDASGIPVNKANLVQFLQEFLDGYQYLLNISVDNQRSFLINKVRKMVYCYGYTIMCLKQLLNNNLFDQRYILKNKNFNSKKRLSSQINFHIYKPSVKRLKMDSSDYS